MFGRNHKENCNANENRVVDAIDIRETILTTMTDEEIIAFGIVYGGKRPEGRFTREWAAKTVTAIARSRLTGMVAIWCLRTDDLDKVDKYLKYFVPEAPRLDKLSVGGDEEAPPIGMEHTHKVMTAGELIGSLIDDVGTRVRRGLPDPAHKLGQPGMETEQPLLDQGQGGEGCEVPPELGSKGPFR